MFQRDAIIYQSTSREAASQLNKHDRYLGGGLLEVEELRARQLELGGRWEPLGAEKKKAQERRTVSRSFSFSLVLNPPNFFFSLHAQFFQVFDAGEMFYDIFIAPPLGPAGPHAGGQV